jgi:pSer/pThr/pTyr-binding forkhead associated (FHA) protein
MSSEAQHPPQHPAQKPPAAPGHLLLQIHFPDESVTTIGLTLKAENTLGRADPVDNYMPDVDLIPHGALKNGVSRRHARLLYENNQLLVEDWHSTNGTRLNETLLEKGQKYPVTDGDTLTLGQLRIQLRFIEENSG